MSINWLRPSIKAERDYFIAAGYAIMVLALIGGIYFRLKGLGKSPFAIDEYYLATSVRNILAHGLPQFACGGYYTRGLLLQYIAVPFFKYGSNDEFYFRLITVFFNLLTVPALYLLAKHVSGRTVACLVVTLFCLSIWQTEFARFARMYAPFQMLFVWYVYFLYRATIFEDLSAKKWMYLISFMSIFVYEGAIFLVLMNFLPFILNGKKISVAESIISVAILLITGAFLATDFRHLGVGDYLSADLRSQATEGSRFPIEKPVFLIATLPTNSVWMWMFLGPLALSGAAIWRLFAQSQAAQKVGLTGSQAVLFSLAIILSLLNLYGLAILLVLCLVILALLLDWTELWQVRIRAVAFPFVVVGLTFIFWLCYGIFTDTWQTLIQTDRISLTERLVIVLFKYPAAMYSKIIFPWFTAMPLFTVATGLLILFGLWESAFRRYHERSAYLFLSLILLGLAVVEVALKEPYYSIRYTFFLYPIVLLVIAVSLKRLAQTVSRTRKTYALSLGGLVLTFTILSEDFGIDHLWNIDSDRVLYRVGYSWEQEQQYYPRHDFRTPASIVNRNLKAGDIVVSTTYGAAYYLRRLDYFYLNYEYELSKVIGTVACGGKKELWANANLIYKSDELLHLLGNAQSTVWLIAQPKMQQRYMPVLVKIEGIFGRFKIFESVDGTINLYKIPKKNDRATAVLRGGPSPGGAV